MTALQLPTATVAATRHSATRIRLSGALHVEIAGRRADGALRGAKGRLLLAYLAIGRGRAFTRDELIDVLWPHEAPNDPDAAFSTVLTRTRQSLGAGVIAGRAELTIQLPAGAWIDWEAMHESVEAAERHLAAGDAARALQRADEAAAIARQPFLPGACGPWVEERRRTAVELYAAALEASGRAALALGGAHLPAAERSARELIAREPYREAAHALLMEAHTARGNVAEALRVFDDLRNLLRDELGLTPAAPIRELAAQLLERQDDEPAPPLRAAAATATAAPASSVATTAALPATLDPSPCAPLVGRACELERLLCASRAARAGGARVALISGEAGIGKTRLAAELARDRRAAGFQVLHGRCDRGAVVPYRAFEEAIRARLQLEPALPAELEPALQPELSELAALIPELRRTVTLSPPDADPETRRHRLFEAVRALFEALLRRGPVLLVLDDLQWAGPPALLLLRHLLRAFSSAPLMIVVTVRDDEPAGADLRALLVDLWRQRALDRVALGGLAPAAAAELIAAHRPAASGVAAHVCAETGGNPFLIEELLSEARAADVPAGIRDTVDWRLERLPAHARELLTLAAASGGGFDAGELAEQAAVPVHDAVAALAAARSAGLIVEEPRGTGRNDFRRALDRRAVLASLPAATSTGQGRGAARART